MAQTKHLDSRHIPYMFPIKNLKNDSFDAPILKNLHYGWKNLGF